MQVFLDRDMQVGVLGAKYHIKHDCISTIGKTWKEDVVMFSVRPH